MSNLIQTIQDEIQNSVPQMIEDSVINHTHNGSDSQNIQAQNLVGAPANAVTPPTGGTVIDVEARQAINDLLSRLQGLNLTN